MLVGPQLVYGNKGTIMRASIESDSNFTCCPFAAFLPLGYSSRRIKLKTPSMPSFAARFAVTALLAMALAAFTSNAGSEPAAQGAPPDAVTEAVAASPAPGSPAKVVVGAYINDIQELDFKSNSYAIDLYVWFRWTPAAEFDPSKSMEFMNRYASDSNIRDELYDKPKPMPDGSVYSIIRYQGQFSTKFQLEKYPFDTQELVVVMEDTVSAADAQIYVPDENGGVTINPDITLPGFKVGKPELHVIERAYPTNFGDLAEPEATDYSRLMLNIPVTRPIVAMSIKTFVPIGLIVVCAALVFFVRLATSRAVSGSASPLF
jgi:hypothetical protein